MSHDVADPTLHPEVQMTSPRGYFLGFAISAFLMLVATFLVSSHAVPPFGLLLVISVCAGIAVIAQIYFLLHIDLSEHNIWNTIAIVLFMPLFLITIGLTWWMFSQLYMRTMDMSAMSPMHQTGIHATVTPAFTGAAKPPMTDMSGTSE